MSAAANFRTAKQLTGGRVLLWSLLGRLPNAMTPIGTLLLVSRNTGSVWSGSPVAGALAGGQALGGPVLGRIADRHGQRTVGLAAALVNAAALITLVVVSERGLPLGWQVVPAARLGEAMAALVSALILAQAAGTFLAGWAAGHVAPGTVPFAAPFAVTTGAAATALAACTATERRYRRRDDPTHAPAPRAGRAARVGGG
ncbi:hypothetical protein [Kitasatospora sp. NPDC059599]|uniref:hypothetical protein n=1 Tax=Kitasatospora sp. NPDC059599 TaxID=3346880 RepID=UPI003680406D